jgi:hypothetical protein
MVVHERNNRTYAYIFCRRRWYLNNHHQRDSPNFASRQADSPNRFLNRRNGRPAFLQGQGDRARKVGANNALLILRSM